MNTKENRRVKTTKKMIKDGLIELMAEKSFSRITVKEICLRADINRSTFYLHYADQYALLEELENDVINMTPRINLKEKMPLYEILLKFFSWIEENKELYLILFRNSNENSFRTKVLDRVFGKNEEKTVWISNMDLENKLHFKMMMSALGGVALIERWLYDEIQSTPEALAKAFCAYVE